MSSSPGRPKSSPSRSSPTTTPKRTPLQEHSQSQTNLLSARLTQARGDGEARNVYTTSPFPTKPRQILLPSTIKKQKSSQNLAEILSPTTPTPARDGQTSRGAARRPQVRLKRSVKTLRDMYEAQSDASRPSTALSNSSRPGTSNSRLRSASSSDGLSGRYAWEQFRKGTSDDLALLPTLPETASTLKMIGPKSSFASRAAKREMMSSPNFDIIGESSSPKIPVYRDLQELSSEESHEPTSDVFDEASSSPIVRQLATSSSIEHITSSEAEPSSDELIEINEQASPSRTIKAVPPSSPIRRNLSDSSLTSRKRKRSEADEGRSFAARVGDRFPTSSPYGVSEASSSVKSLPSIAEIKSSPPVHSDRQSTSFDDSSPVVQILNADTSSPARHFPADSHSSLQAALTSTPQPSLQYPLVKAPSDAQIAGIVIPKRKYRLITGESSQQSKWPSRLAAVPSEISLPKSQNVSKRSSWIEEGDELDSDSLAPAEAYMMSESANNSLVRIIPDSERHEGEDEVTALPGDGFDYRSPPMGPARGNSYMSSSGSSQSRLNSLQSVIDTRLNSMRSFNHSRQGSFRPSSSDSINSVLAVPTWARRYYSGFYPDSFRFLAQSTTSVNVITTDIKPQPPIPSGRPESLATSRSSRVSIQSFRDSFKVIPRLLRTKNRPRLEARKSHVLPGVGPLCSNPVRGPATAAIPQNQAHWDPRSTIRPVSFPLDPADPRAHWNGVTEDMEFIPEDGLPQPPYSYQRSVSNSTNSENQIRPVPQTYHAYRNRLSHVVSSSPHLHHDHRLNTGSTASRGFGYPFNRKSRFSAPSIFEEARSGSAGKLHTAQIACFAIGFVFPLSWIIGALLPLPPRPESYHDLEKGAWQRASADVSDFEDMDVIARLRLEKQIRGVEEMRWQNAKWWKMLNRWMCIVAILVIILVIVLAVLGTTANL